MGQVASERVYLAIVKPPSRDDLRHAIRKDLVDKLPLVLAVVEEKVVGWCSVARDCREGFRHTGVLGIGLVPLFRERGIGRKLLDATLEKAGDIGIRRIELEVFASNERAICFYRREKFTVEGIKRSARFLDERFEDIVCMARFV